MRITKYLRSLKSNENRLKEELIYSYILAIA